MKINDFMEFRAKCYQTYKVILKIAVNRYGHIAVEDKDEEQTKISKTTVRNNDFYHETDNPVNVFKSDENVSKINSSDAEYEMSVEEVIENSYDINYDSIISFEKVDLFYDKMEPKTEKVKPKRLSTAGFVCKFCYEKFRNKISMYNHYKTHTGKTVICEHCGAKFSTKRRLLVHCRAKHGYEKIDKCSYCDYTASNAESVKIHERTHTGEKPFVCAQCGAAFHRRSCYLQHIPIHLSQKTVQCEECPSMFKSVTLMKIHKARHKKRNGRTS